MQRGYGKQVDVWSLGVILFILLCGYPPFYDESDAVLFELIMKGRFHFDERYWRDVSDSAKHLIRNMLQVDPVKRYNTYMVLQHPWITGEVEVPRLNLSKSISVNLKKTGLGHAGPLSPEEGSAGPSASAAAATGLEGQMQAMQVDTVTSVMQTAAAVHPAGHHAAASTTGHYSHSNPNSAGASPATARRPMAAGSASPARSARAAKLEQFNRPDARKTMV